MQSNSLDENQLHELNIGWMVRMGGGRVVVLGGWVGGGSYYFTSRNRLIHLFSSMSL